jgi:hypothetical protein
MEVVDPIPIPTQSDSDCDLVTPQVENAIEIIDVEEESKSSTGGPARTRTAVSILEEEDKYVPSNSESQNVELVIDLCIRDLQPFKSVAHSGFRNILGRHDKRFKPTDPSGASMIIDEVYNVVLTFSTISGSGRISSNCI